MNRLEIIASEKNGKFGGINPVIFIAFAGDQLVAARLRDNEFLDLFVEVAIEPAGHRVLFHREDLPALEQAQDRADCRYARRHGISCHDLTSLFDGQFGILRVHVCSNVVRYHGDLLSHYG